jgi:hypothetical protein
MKTHSEKQKVILTFAKSHNNQISKQQAVDLLKYYYYSNAQKYVGEILSRMVVSKILKRVKNGLFEINSVQSVQGVVNPDQLKLL